MKRCVVLGTVVVAGALSMTLAAFQQPAQPEEKLIQVDKIKQNLYVLKGGGGNTAVFITRTGVVVVDTKNPGWGQPILDTIMDKNNGGSGLSYSGTIARAAAADHVDTIINGHNPTTTTTADLKLYSEFIADFVTFVQDAKNAGKSIDDVVKTWAVPAKYAGYSKPNLDRVRADAQVIWDETK
jgi:hypothetical protein